MKQSFFHKKEDSNLFCSLYQPDHNIRKNGLGIVFCSPFAEEKLWSQRIFVNFAYYLTQNSFTVLTFDYMGHGDSGGNFEDSDVESRIRDIQIALDVIKERTMIKRVGLLGLRFGATLASIFAEKIDIIDFLLLWEPITHGEKYLKQCLRSNLSTQMATYKKISYTREQMIMDLLDSRPVNIDGYLMSGRFYKQAVAIDIVKMPLKYSHPVLIAHISRNKSGKIPRNISELSQKYSQRNSHSELLTVIEKPFWGDIKEYSQRSDNLFSSTLRFLKKLI